ncbi:hypothetical protein [Mycoplasma suis]|uniref:Uncharacterized protein n=1 Tax=Mycoplasma suis (strain Illinois) TaxID=768700 RepID=F0QRS1_MYCSL|nr:hypothetical protein [Mycoplasma suis]ADX98191.1 hypothetical protein MSU_0660 [Mycoplasma suis str. Illinois]
MFGGIKNTGITYLKGNCFLNSPKLNGEKEQSFLKIRLPRKSGRLRKNKRSKNIEIWLAGENFVPPSSS